LFLQEVSDQWGMVVHACNLSTQDAEAGEFLIWGQSELHSEYEVSLDYKARLYLKKTKQNKKPGASGSHL
jgi:hypothetical protein